ncbi:pyruvate, phosphate dikinase/phosphoenolpyruvate synthase regulator [Rhodococcus antarcticus]|uniref:Putative phosphoenolpyruvate synthase regulatory protein n=1 Tax=Rhodococcus antarcticus TaxID=2987751 RepID=A0ABY6P510_9NOCA|nr:pyruvate, phosphate dikinase/phosphoenolpyruvate synthase regulator [Rhodococcus antarcticus]UZJ26248.1 pyruvate, phosphate dikinase/phosphoenolpyruvate synthase regulator [Rhodococcus antarcticus]
MTAAVSTPDDDHVVPVFFLSDSTGISAETMGNALLIQFPDVSFERTLIPFISTVEQAREVVAQLDEAMEGPVTPLVFTTAAVDEVREELLRTRAPIIDFFGMHMGMVEAQLGQRGLREARRLHGVGDVRRYNSRMAAIEFAIEHDDGLGTRGLDRADVVLLAPSRCGKTPTAMYLALQHGLFVANYPLVDEDLETTDLPRPVQDLAGRCFGLTTTASRLSRVRQERRPDSRYASEDQCRWELRQAGEMYSTHHLPTVDTSAASVEEIAAVVIQTLARQRRADERSGRDQPRGRTTRA